MASPLRWVPLALLLNLAASLRLPKPMVRTGNDAIWLLHCLKLRSAGCRLGTDLELKQSGSKGLGLFAKRSIDEGSLIGRYDGELLTLEEYDARRLEMEPGQGMYVMEMNNGYLLVCHAGFEPQTSRPQTDLLLTRARLALHRTARTQRSRRSCGTSTIPCVGPTARLSRWWTRNPQARLLLWPLWRKGTLPWAKSYCSIVRRFQLDSSHHEHRSAHTQRVRHARLHLPCTHKHVPDGKAYWDELGVARFSPQRLLIDYF